MNFDILNIEFFLPKKIELNSALEISNIYKKKLIKNTGVLKRRIAGPKDNVISMSVKAAIKILKKKNTKIDFLILVTQSPLYPLPTNSCIIHNNLGLNNDCLTFDINQGCSGFINAMEIANSLFMSNSFNYGLIICSDTYTKYIKEDINVKSLFSDSASAILLKKNKLKHKYFSDYGIDGNGASNLMVKNNKLFMNGPAMLQFIINNVYRSIIKTLKKNKLTICDIDYYIFHQASKLAIDSLSKKLNLEEKKVYFNIKNLGNTVSSSIPIAIKDASKKKLIKKNSLILMSGFGVGYSWATCIYKNGKIIK